MAGHRSQEQTPQHETRQQRRRERMAVRMAAAATPSERIAAAADHLRAALAYTPGPVAETIAARVVQVLMDAVEQAYREESRAAAARRVRR